MDRAEPSDPPPGTVLRTVIVDDHELLRAGTRGILEDADGFAVVGEAADAEEALSGGGRHRAGPGDHRHPSADHQRDRPGRPTGRRPPRPAVVILSAYDDEHYVRAALAAGVRGYLLKTLPSHELVAALRDACTGVRAARCATPRPG